MKTLKSLLPVLIAFALFSCKKSTTVPPVTPGVAKIKTVNYNNGTSIYNYEYDAAGKITKIVEPVTGQKTEYTYQGNSKVIVKTYDAAGALTSQVTYELNSQRLAEAITNPVSTAIVTNEFSSNRQLVKRLQTNANSSINETRYSYAVDGRLDSVIYQFTNSVGVVTTRYKLTYQYSITKPYSIANENQGFFFLGTQTINPYDKEIYKNLLNLTPEVETNYSYEYDAQNRITKQTYIPPPPSAQNVTTYTYY